MDPDQLEAFRSANSGASSVDPNALLFLIAGILAAGAILWYAWLLLQAYKGWGNERIASANIPGIAFRGLFILVVILALLAMAT